MKISQSIFSLAKKNNGFFKSEKQGQYLIAQLSEYDGCIGHADSGYNSCPIFADWDNKGIIKIVKSSKNGDVIMFERKIKGTLTSLQIKEIKSYQRRIKALQKEIDDYQKSFDSGDYNNSGDISTYSKDMIEKFNYFQNQRKEQLNNLQQKIKI